MPGDPRKMKFSELMSWLGNAQPGSIARPPLEAEFERRKYRLTVWGLVIAGSAVLVTIAYNTGVFELIRMRILK